jgi:hypothetical protein
MKPSHFTTPRTLSECQFTTGYQSHRFTDRLSPVEFIIQAAIGLMLISPALAWAFGYWG